MFNKHCVIHSKKTIVLSLTYGGLSHLRSFPYSVTSCRMPSSILHLFASRGPVYLPHHPWALPRFPTSEKWSLPPYAPVACVFLLVAPSCTVVQVVHSPAPGVPSLTVHVSVFRWLPGSCAVPKLCGRVCSPALQRDTGVLTFMWLLVFFLCLCQIDCCLKRGR